MLREAKSVPESGEDPAREGEDRSAALAIPAVVLDTAVGVFMLAAALWFWFGAADIQTQSAFSLSGPVAFPRGVAALLAVCSLLLIGRSLGSRRGRGRSPRVRVERPAQVAVAMGLVVGYPLLIGVAGYYVGTGLWLPVVMWVSGYRRPLGLVLVSAGFLAFTKIVFEHMLGTPMP